MRQRMPWRWPLSTRTGTGCCMAMLSLIFTVVGIVLVNQPMAMRHGP